jgi:hypothetical protein
LRGNTFVVAAAIVELSFVRRPVALPVAVRLCPAYIDIADCMATESGVREAFRQVQAALLPWLACTPDELTSANTAASVRTGFAMSWSGRDEPPAAESASKADSSRQPPGTPAPRP